jgi:vacuolar-type H+-ATPase subunit B/Vma2
MAFAVAERLSVKGGRRVPVVPTDMAAHACVIEEVGIAPERAPWNRRTVGDLRSEPARRCETPHDHARVRSLTIRSVTTMRGGDVTLSVPDDITEGWLHLHGGAIDSPSRLERNAIGCGTPRDHVGIANTMIRLRDEARAAAPRRAMTASGPGTRSARGLRSRTAWRSRRGLTRRSPSRIGWTTRRGR